MTVGDAIDRPDLVDDSVGKCRGDHMEVADAGLGDPDVSARSVDVGRQLTGDPGEDRVEGEGQREGERDAAHRREEPDPVPRQVAAGQEEGGAHPRNTSAGSSLATDRAGISAARRAMRRLLASTIAAAAGSMATRNCGRHAMSAAPAARASPIPDERPRRRPR